MKKLIKIVFALFFFNLYSQSPTVWNGVGIGGGGALFCPSINPNNSNEMYVSCDMGGLYHTSNQGSSWKLLPFQQIRGGHYSKINFTNNPLIRYTISYKSHSEDFIRPFKTVDGGLTWTKLEGNPNDYETLYALYVNYDNPNQVIINDYISIFFSNDGGTTFSQVYAAANSGAGCKLSGVFWDGNNIYCGTSDGIIRSINGGANFSLWSTTGIESGQTIASFSAAKVGGNTRFYVLTANSDNVYNGDIWDYYEYGKKVYSMDNTSGNWNDKTSNFNYTINFATFLRTAKNNLDTVYLAGSDNTGFPTILKTSNAGNSWSNVFSTSNNQNIITSYCGHGGDLGWSWAEVVFGFDVNPNNVEELLITDYGFIHKSTNGGTSWSQIYSDSSTQNNSNSMITPKQDYKSAGDLNQISVWQMHWQDTSNLWACTSDIKGTRSTNGGNLWSFNFNNHNENTSYRIVKNPTTNTMYMATASVHDLYQSTRLANNTLDASDNTGFVKFSTNNGLNWQVMKDFSDIVCWVALDPNNSNKLYASVVNSTNGNGGIWVTSNANLGAASTWTKLPNPPRTSGHPFNIVVLNDGKVLASYSGHRNPDFTNSSGVFLYNPITNSWEDKSHEGMFYWTQDVIVDPNDIAQNTWYACVYDAWGNPNAQNVGGLYKTTNRGLSWSKIWSNLRCTSATITNTNKIYITTEYDGLYYSENSQSDSPIFTQTNFPYRNTVRTFINPYDSNEVWVTTFGGGSFKGNIINLNSDSFNTSLNDFLIYPNPASSVLNIENLTNSTIEKISIYDLTGGLVLEKNILTQDDVKLYIDKKLLNGIYLLKISTNKEIMFHKIIIND